MTPSDIKQALEGGAIDRDLILRVALLLTPESMSYRDPNNLVISKFRGRFTTLLEVGAYTEAALALVEEVLPGWSWHVSSPDTQENDPKGKRQSFRCFLVQGLTSSKTPSGEANAPAPAILLALINAKEKSNA